MRYVRASFFIVLIAASLAAGTTASAQPEPAFAAYRTVCNLERTRLISDLRQEIKAAQQPTWTPAQESQRLEADFREAYTATAEQLQKFEGIISEAWKEATDFIQKPELLLAACAVTVARGWHAGVRDVTQLSQKWLQARPGYASGNPARPSAPSPVPTPAPSSDEGASLPVDCLRLNDTPGSFKNVCDFPVYFTYCGINPKPDSWVGRCDDPNHKLGLDGVAARGVQAAFTGAETMHWFACRKPKVPKDVKFITGKGLYGSCK